ncbi:MAG TPA: PAS domain S-box protein, partial [Dongiaceae bacterium]|nr:PAS domain S-box protein [Dongiaceae bacterium]
MTLSAPILIGLLAVAAAIAIAAIWSRARTGAAAGDLARALAELRRHPRVGAAPQAAHPALQPAAAAVGELIEDLRALLVRAEERAGVLQSLADGPGDVALIGLDAEWVVASFSRGASELTGWGADEMSGRHVEILFAPGEWERLLPKLARRTLREAGFAETARLLTREGRERTCRLSFGPGGGAQAGTLVVARDLGAEIELERRLRQSEERHRSLVESIKDAVVVLQEGRVVYANPALARLLGGERGEFNGKLFKELIEARDLLRVVDLLTRAERGTAETDEVVCRLARPGTPPIEARLTWAATEYGGRRALYCTISDMSDRVRQERALSDSEARLRSTLEAAADALVVFNVTPSGMKVASANRAAIALAGEAGLAPGMTPATLAGRFALPADALAVLLAAAGEGRDAARAG